MSKLDPRRMDEVARRYPSDRCRQIATYVLEDPRLPDNDRLRAAGILGALDAADHVHYLAVVEVSYEQLVAAATLDADRLWARYEEDDSQGPSSNDGPPGIEPPPAGRVSLLRSMSRDWLVALANSVRNSEPPRLSAVANSARSSG